MTGCSETTRARPVARLLTFVLAALTSACARSSARESPGNPTAAAATAYVVIAEGLTADSADGAMVTEPRMFSTPDLPTRCSHASSLARLAATDRVNVRIGEPFSLGALRVVALDGAGAIIPRVPVVIEVEPVSPPILDLSSERLERGPIAMRPGAFMIRVRTICPGLEAAPVMIPARALRR